MKKTVKRNDKVFVGVWLTKKQVRMLKEVGRNWEVKGGRGETLRVVIEQVWGTVFNEFVQNQKLKTPPSIEEALDSIGE